jgi:hypothetical protein
MDDSAEQSGWRLLLPRVNGQLPNGVPLTRTEPSGSFSARIGILGAYPAAAGTRQTKVDGVAMQLPVAVEAESFAPTSESGRKLDTSYLQPLGLGRDDVLITDIVPYYLANTTPSTSGRSMASGFTKRRPGNPPASQLVRNPAIW